MKRILILILFLFVAYPVSAQKALRNPIETGGLFTEQCETVYYAVYYSFERPRGKYLDLELLMALEIDPGIWEGYDSATPFGVEFLDNRNNEIYLYTPCGIKYSRIRANKDDSWTIFVFRDTEATDFYNQPCQMGDGSDRCGLHHFSFGYISAAEWEMVVNG